MILQIIALNTKPKKMKINPPQKIPLLFTTVCDNDLYLVNNMDFTILKVRVDTCSIQETIQVSSSDKMIVNLKPQSIVKIEEYDPIPDSDLTTQTIIEIFWINNDTLESEIFKLPVHKGKFVSNVILYSDALIH